MKGCFLGLVLVTLSAFAQDATQHFTINVGTPEGQALQAITNEPAGPNRVTMMNDFLAKYPKHEGASWVATLLEAAYVGQKEYDKAIEAADKGLAADPNDLDLAYATLKTAEAKGDVEQIKKYSGMTSDAARKIAAKAPANDEDKARIEYAKQIDVYSEYALSTAALKAQEPAKVVELVEALEQRNPKSQYLAQVSGVYLYDLGKTGQAGKACGAAERLGAANAKDVDALIWAADCNLRASHADRAVAEASKALEGLNSADVGARRGAISGHANWVLGVAYGSQQKWGLANKALRAALPMVKGDAGLAPAAYFFLGLSNYNLGKAVGDKSQMKEGLQFFEQCSEMKSNYQGQASQNVRVIKQELGVR